MGEKPFVTIAEKYFERFPSFNLRINDAIKVKPSIVIVIPVFNEPNIKPTLDSLFFKQETYNFQVEIILIVNHSSNASKSVKKTNYTTFDTLKEYATKHNSSKISIHPFFVNDLHPKHAGVGWARKIGMDIALRRYKECKYNGVIVGLDADSTVSENYLNEINKFFKISNYTAVSIYFEHPIKGEEYDEVNYNFISLYELHLRYYKNALSFVGFPYAFHTVGSSFALTAKAYARQGGMNRRKAGEDFYFINKLIKGESFGEINTAKVMPSPRISTRVPFGTGRAILDATRGDKNLNITYDFKIFMLLRTWFDSVSRQNFSYDDFPNIIKDFINENDWLENHNQILSNCRTHVTYMKKFCDKYDAFWVLKFIHFCRDGFFNNSSLIENCQQLLSEMKIKCAPILEDQLELFRHLDKKRGNRPSYK